MTPAELEANQAETSEMIRALKARLAKALADCARLEKAFEPLRKNTEWRRDLPPSFGK